MSGSERVAVVTGAARGIGLSIAKGFLARGWRVAAIDILESVQDVAELGSAERFVCDVSSEAAVTVTFAEIGARFGRIDALVNNAGIAVFGPLQAFAYKDWQAVMRTNLDGPFLCSMAGLPWMEAAGGGAIVNIASISGMRASTLRVAYGTSKAGLMHLTQQLAVELGDRGIRVNTVAPGPVDTAMATAVHSPEIRAAYRDALPLGRYGTEDEIAAGVLFLCSDEASFVTGQCLGVDGGFEAAGIGLPALRTQG